MTLLACCIFSAAAIEIGPTLGYRVTKDDALAIAKRNFSGRDVDYYLQENDVSSVMDGSTVKTVDAQEGTKTFTIDASGITPGLYVVNYTVNSEVVDSKKIAL